MQYMYALMQYIGGGSALVFSILIVFCYQEKTCATRQIP